MKKALSLGILAVLALKPVECTGSSLVQEHLAGLKAVFLVVYLTPQLGEQKGAAEAHVRSAAEKLLKSVGIAPDGSPSQSLAIQADSQPVPECPKTLVVRVRISFKERVSLLRSPRREMTQSVPTWQDELMFFSTQEHLENDIEHRAADLIEIFSGEVQLANKGAAENP